MEATENITSVPDMVSQIKEEYVWPLEVEIEPEEIPSKDGQVNYLQEDLNISLEHICSLCSYSGSSLGDLRRHIKLEHEQKLYKQPIFKLKLEKNELNDEENYCDMPFLECSICGYKTRLKSRLAEHILAHSGSKQFSCEYCSYKTSNVNHLRQHIARHMGIRPYACSDCGYGAQSLGDLRKHARVHNGIKPFVCELCNYATTTNNYLKMHMSKHTGERPFKCEHCSYTTARRGDLTSHQLTHSTDKPYMCPCGFKTARPAHLKRHMNRHSITRRFECRRCNKRYNLRDELKRHLETHKPDKPRSCPYCDYQTLAGCTLKRHIIRKHSQENISKTDNKPDCPQYNDEIKKEVLLEHNGSNENSFVEKPPDGKSSPRPERKPGFVCYHCDYFAKQFQDLEEHISSQHSKSKVQPG